MSRCVLRVLILAAALVVHASVSQAVERPHHCPATGSAPLVYGIGSSTMGVSLGPQLKSALEPLGFRFRKWGVASSGLARPDFHDWPARIPGLIKEQNPAIWVISIGTNDFQAIHTGKGWVKTRDSERWKAIYSRRVDQLLDRASGKDRSRMVIWITPTIFDTHKARKMGRWVHDIVATRIAAFDGPAFLVDTYTLTTDRDGVPRKTFRRPGADEEEPIYLGDKIHLTENAVRWLMVEPVVKIARPCAPPQTEDPGE